MPRDYGKGPDRNESTGVMLFALHCSWSTREALIIGAGGERFHFCYDLEVPEVLHITLRHGTTPEDAIRAFFEGEQGPWNEARRRFESVSDTHGLY